MRTTSNNLIDNHHFTLAGIFTLALRLVAGWTYFSAFWRRLVLENKLDPEAPGYIGEKFNHFLPNALGIGPLIEYLVSTPEALWWFMLVFTLVEGVVGLLFMLGIFTRLMSLGVFGLAMGILLGAGWLGTTCLDEWQIGILGIAAGFTVFLSGGGYYALDRVLAKNKPELAAKNWFPWFASGLLPISENRLRKLALSGTAVIVFLSLFTNQYFHGGLWGKLHNLSVKPHLTITELQLNRQELKFTVFRDQGADVYGSFLIGISLHSAAGKTILNKDHRELAQLPASALENHYVAKVKPGKHSLIIPLGAKANLTLHDEALSHLPSGLYTLKLTDISGLEWTKEVEL